MADTHEELLDYEEDEIKPILQDNHADESTPLNPAVTVGSVAKTNATGGLTSAENTTSYVGSLTTGFKDFLLKPELLKSIREAGFEHPSEVQQEAIPQAIMGMDLICQAKSGTGKTCVFVVSSLQQIDATSPKPCVLALAHTHELALQIEKEYKRFSAFTNIRTECFYGKTPIEPNRKILRESPPHIIVGTPGRISQLVEENSLNLSQLQHFILDECDKMLEGNRMRDEIQNIFKHAPRRKQVMMFTATLPKMMRPICKKFMKNPLEIFVDDDTKLTLHGLQQYYLQLNENEKILKLKDLLEVLDYNQVVIFVKNFQRATKLNDLMVDAGYPTVCIHGKMDESARNEVFTSFKNLHKRILISTDLVGRGIDIEHVNIVFNFDMPMDDDTYLHRVARAGRFNTKGLALTFVSSNDDRTILNKVQERFEVDVKEMPENIDPNSYMNK